MNVEFIYWFFFCFSSWTLPVSFIDDDKNNRNWTTKDNQNEQIQYFLFVCLFAINFNQKKERNEQIDFDSIFFSLYTIVTFLRILIPDPVEKQNIIGW